MIDWTQIIIAAVGLLFTAVIIPLVRAGFEWLKGRTENEAIRAAMSEAERVADYVVAGLQANVVDGLKEASADGKLTSEEITSIGVTAFNSFKRNLSEKAFEILSANADSISDYVADLIEARLAQLKK